MRSLGVAAALVAVAGAAAAIATAGHVRWTAAPEEHVVATHAGPLGYDVFLPPDYAASGKRYPVVYFLHGLPAGSRAFRAYGWLDEALEKTGRDAILVVPEAAREGDTDPEYLGRWETAIAADVPRAVDARFRTIPTRDGRALVGLSAGGYGAMHLALAHLGAFRVVEAWSGYFHPTDPTGQLPLDLGSAAKNAAANVHRQFRALEGRLDRLPLYIAFYVGRSDPTFVAENVQLNQELSAAGIPHVFRLYPGGHSQALWAAEAPAWLTLALNHLVPAR